MEAVLRYLGHGRWKVMQDLVWRDIVVPKGFVTDLDSVPRIPMVYAKFKGRTTPAAVIHDFLYDQQFTTRKEADKLFNQAMKDEGVSSYHRRPIYWAVRMFGGFAWNRSRK